MGHGRELGHGKELYGYAHSGQLCLVSICGRAALRSARLRLALHGRFAAPGVAGIKGLCVLDGQSCAANGRHGYCVVVAHGGLVVGSRYSLAANT